MGHHPGQGVLQVLRQQGIEVVGVEIVAVGHGHQAHRRAQPRRWRQGGGAGPAQPGGHHLQEVLLAADRAEAPLIQAGGELLAPLAGEGAAAGIGQPRTKGPLEELLEGPGVQGPGEQGRRMLDRIWAVAAIVRIEHKQWLLGIEPPAGGKIQTGDRPLQRSLEGIVAGEQMEQQHGQGEEIGAAIRSGLAQGHLRRHEPPGAHHGAAAAATHLHVVVVADQDAAPPGIQEQIPQGHVLVTEAEAVQGMEGPGQEEGTAQHVLEADREPARRVVHGPAEAGGAQGHQIAKARGSGARQRRRRIDRTQQG